MDILVELDRGVKFKKRRPNEIDAQRTWLALIMTVRCLGVL